MRTSSPTLRYFWSAEKGMVVVTSCIIEKMWASFSVISTIFPKSPLKFLWVIFTSSPIWGILADILAIVCCRMLRGISEQVLKSSNSLRFGTTSSAVYRSVSRSVKSHIHRHHRTLLGIKTRHFAFEMPDETVALPVLDWTGLGTVLYSAPPIPAGIQSFQWNSTGIRLKSSRLRLKYCRYCPIL